MAERTVTVHLLGDAGGAVKAARDAEHALGSLDVTLKGVSTRAIATGTALGEVLVQSARRAVTEAASLTTSWADAGSMIHDLAQRTGFSTVALSEWKYAADQSGTSIDGLEVGIRKMERTVVEANDGVKTATETLAAIGVKVSELRGQQPEQIFDRMVTGLAGVNDETTQAALSVDLFGKSGTQLLPILKDGAQNIAQMREEAHRLGIVFTQEDANAADTAGDAFHRMDQAIAGAKFQLSRQLAPAAVEVANTVTRLAGDVDVLKGSMLGMGAVAAAATIPMTGPVGLAVAAGFVGAAVLTMKGHWEEAFGALPQSTRDSLADVLEAMRGALEGVGVMFEGLASSADVIAETFAGVATVIKQVALAVADFGAMDFKRAAGDIADIPKEVGKSADAWHGVFKGFETTPDVSKQIAALRDPINPKTGSPYGADYTVRPPAEPGYSGGAGLGPGGIHSAGGTTERDPLVEEWKRIHEEMAKEQARILETSGEEQLHIRQQHDDAEVAEIQAMADRIHQALGIDMADAVTDAFEFIKDKEEALLQARKDAAEQEFEATKKQMDALAELAKAERALADERRRSTVDMFKQLMGQGINGANALGLATQVTDMDRIAKQVLDAGGTPEQAAAAANASRGGITNYGTIVQVTPGGGVSTSAPIANQTVG